MAAINYEVFLLDPGGTRLRLISDYLDLSVVLVVNDIGVANVVLSGTRHSYDLFNVDYQIEIERNGQSIGGAPFLIRRSDLVISQSRIIELTAYHANHLLDRKDVAYYSGSAGAGATTETCDNLMKRLVRENIGEDAQTGPHVVEVADSLRDYPAPDISALFTVAADETQAPTTTREFARRQLLPTLQDIAEDSYGQGMPLFFGITKNTDTGLLTFETKTGQWGTDRSANDVVSPGRGNLVNARKSRDWSRQVTVGYALGQNEAEGRAVAISLSDDRNLSPFNWIERTTDARNISTTNSLQAEANAFVQANRRIDGFSGKLQDIPSFRFKRHWDWGDKLRVEIEGEEANAWVNKISITYRNKKENIDAQIEAVQ